MLASTERVQAELEAIRRYPIRFVERTYGEEVVGKQRDILAALAEPGVEEVHVRSCHASGKTHICARATSWWLQAYPGDSMVVTTAPTWKQVGEQLWAEIRDGDQRSRVKLGGELGMLKWEFGPKWKALGIATSPNTAVNIQGFHATHVLIVVDEADGIEQRMWDALDGLQTSGHVVLLCIGNPINADSPWHKIVDSAKTNPLARVFKIAAEDVLPHSGEARPFLLQQRYVDRALAKWGPSHPLYVAKVLAEWPTISKDTVIPLPWLERARFRAVERGPVGLGVDVAREGVNLTVRTLVAGHQLLWQRATSKEDTMQTANRTYRDMEDYGPIATAVDDSGLGGGVTDRLRELRKVVTPVRNGSRALDHDNFDNRGSEMWWSLRLAFEQDLIGLATDDSDTDLDDLIAQLGQVKYQMVGPRIHVDKYGLGRSEHSLTIEEKALSPDRADSFVLAWNAVQPFVPKSIVKPQETDLARMRREVYQKAAGQQADPWGI